MSIVLLLAVLFAALPVNAEETYTVQEVVDAATIKLTNGQTVRLIGVEIPHDEEMAQRAKTFVEGMLPNGAEVSLESDVQTRDHDGRLLAYVRGKKPFIYHEKPAADAPQPWVQLPDEFMMNERLLQFGYALSKIEEQNVKYADDLKNLMYAANQQKRGIWNTGCAAKEKCEWLNCAAFDNLVKTGYKPDCVEGICKCMCYGCL